MKEKYFPFGEREISWLCSRDPQFGAVISKMEKPKRKLLPDISREFFEHKKALFSPYSTTASIYFRAISTGKRS